MLSIPPGPALQDAWPDATCYGCGPANPQGLRIKSYWTAEGDEVFALFTPRPEHNAGFPNVTYGGLVAALIDCHSIWTAIAWTYREAGREHGSLPAISYVTGTLTVRYRHPTPLDVQLVLRAHVTELHPKKALVLCTLGTESLVTAEAEVVAVRFGQDKSLGG